MKNENTIENWGKDHWSALAYIEHLATENNGIAVPVEARMRTNRRHASPGNNTLADKYPTLLKNGEIKHHDDWDCLNDMIEHNFLLNVGTETTDGYSLTPKGRNVANAIREHKANGGSFRTFECNIDN